MIRQRRYHLELRTIDALEDCEATADLRRALKHLLRACRLRCEQAYGVEPDDRRRQRGRPSASH